MTEFRINKLIPSNIYTQTLIPLSISCLLLSLMSFGSATDSVQKESPQTWREVRLLHPFTDKVHLLHAQVFIETG